VVSKMYLEQYSANETAFGEVGFANVHAAFATFAYLCSTKLLPVQHQALTCVAPNLYFFSTKLYLRSTKLIEDLRGDLSTALLSVAPTWSEPPSGHLFVDHVRNDSTCLELCELGHNAGLGSRGEGHLSADDVAFDDGAQREHFCVWFLVHRCQKF